MLSRDSSVRDSDVQCFWKHVNKEGVGGCWLWTASLNHNGYGRGYVRWCSCRAHRLSWRIHNGPIPAGLFVLHNCPGGDNRACVNPAHLWLGTHQQNMADMVAKGTTNKGRKIPSAGRGGEEHNQAKLTWKKVRLIRSLYATGKYLQRQLAERFDVKNTTISYIITQRLWKGGDPNSF